MCGRYALYSNPATIAKMFSIKQTSFNLSYNVAPTENISVLVMVDEERFIDTMRWGLIPRWSNDKSAHAPLINARAETIDTKPAFSSAVKSRRCLIIANGFYEWKEERGIKQPYFIQLKSQPLFAMAGIWEKGISKDESINSCAIITMDAANFLSKFHDRSPALIKPSDYNGWLDSKNQDWQTLKLLLSSFQKDDTEVYPVSTQVNKATYKEETCIRKINI